MSCLLKQGRSTLEGQQGQQRCTLQTCLYAAVSVVKRNCRHRGGKLDDYTQRWWIASMSTGNC